MTALVCALVTSGTEAIAQTVPESAPPVSSFVVAGSRIGCVGSAAGSVDLACNVTAQIEHRGTFHVACDDGSVRSFTCATDRAPQLVARHEAPARVRSLFVRDDRVWIEVERIEALPLAQATRVDPSEPAVVIGVATQAPANTRAVRSASVDTAHLADDDTLSTPARDVEQLEGHVTQIRGTDAIVDLGADDGVTTDMHVEIGTPSGHTRDALGLEVLHSVIGRVVDVTADECRVALVLGEPVTVGQSAHVTDLSTTGSMLAPERLGGRFRARVATRPALLSPGAQFGLMTDVSVEYHFTFPFTLRAVLSPFGFVAGQNTSAAFAVGPSANVRTTVFASFVAEFDSRYFALGLGAGYASIPVQRFVFTPSGGTPFTPSATSGMFALGFTLRVGTEDGLNLAAHLQIGLAETEWVFAGLHVTAQIPVERRYAIVLHSGAAPGISGLEHFVTEIGLRVLANGHGGRGTVFLTPLIGAVSVASSNVGPMVGISADMRY